MSGLRLFPVLVAFLVTWARIQALAVPYGGLKPAPYYSEIAQRFAGRFPRKHLTRLSLDDTVSSRTCTNYLSSLDYDRVYFLESDIVRFEKDQLNLDDALKNGDVSFAYEVFEVFRDRVRNRNQYISRLLEKDFELNQKESYRWRRKNAPWPKDEAEWNEIWRKKIKNEYVQRVVAAEVHENVAVGDVEVNTEGQDEIPDLSHGTQVKDAPVSPEDFIRERYKQFLTAIDDSDSEWVLERYLSAFAHSYDPHSLYMSPSAVENFDIQMKLSLVGIGALLRAEDGAAKVERIIVGGPADRDKREKRLRPGDKIIAVAQDGCDPVDILHCPLYKIVKLIRGEKGSRVILTVIPASDPTGSSTKQVDLVRDEVKLEEQAAKLKISQVKGSEGVALNLGVITIPAFYASMTARSVGEPGYRSSSYDVGNLLKNMKQMGAEGLVLDLRNNGGGSLPEAVKMTGHFIDMGPVVQVKERRGIRVLSDRDPNAVYSGPMVVLVNRLSASASEILAGALQDYGRAVIVGDSKTHGKGTVQTILGLGNDTRLGSIKVTSWIFYRISGNSTQRKGVSPDIVISSAVDRMEFDENFLPNAIEWSKANKAEYSPSGDLSSVIPALKVTSARRRVENPDLAAYAKLLSHVNLVSKREELPLNIIERKKLARTEKELSDLQSELTPGEDNAAQSEQKGKRDVVLAESLKILADLVALQKKGPEPNAEQVTSNNKDPVQVIAEWLKNKL